MEFSWQEYWSRLPFPSPRDLSDPGIKPKSSALQMDSLPFEPPEDPTGDGLLVPSSYCRGVGEVGIPPSGSIGGRHHLVTVRGRYELLPKDSMEKNDTPLL